MFRFVIPLACMLLLPVTTVAQETNVTRYLYGTIGNRQIVMILEFGPELTPINGYNIQGQYVALDEPRPLPRSLLGRWPPESHLLALQGYRVELQEYGSMRKEQTEFFAGEIRGASQVDRHKNIELHFEGTWIETDSLTYSSFYLGREFTAKQRLEFNLNEGGRKSPSSLSGTFACRLPNQAFAMSVKDGRILSFSLSQERDVKPFVRQIDLANLESVPRLRAISLVGKSQTPADGCIVSILDLGRYILLSTEPLTCSCRARVFIDKTSNGCFDLFTSNDSGP